MKDEVKQTRGGATMQIVRVARFSRYWLRRASLISPCIA